MILKSIIQIQFIVFINCRHRADGHTHNWDYDSNGQEWNVNWVECRSKF